MKVYVLFIKDLNYEDRKGDDEYNYEEVEIEYIFKSKRSARNELRRHKRGLKKSKIKHEWVDGFETKRDIYWIKEYKVRESKDILRERWVDGFRTKVFL